MSAPAVRSSCTASSIRSLISLSSSGADSDGSFMISMSTSPARRGWKIARNSHGCWMICKNHKVDTIITTSVSRFGRNIEEALIALRGLKSSGVEIIFEAEDIFTSAADSELMITIIEGFAQAENEARNEDHQRGRHGTHHRGHFTGGGAGQPAPEEMPPGLALQDRALAGFTAPAQEGLILWEVKY